MRLDIIPSELKSRRQWTVWKFHTRQGKAKPVKLHYTPATLQTAKSDDKTTWGTYNEAVKALRKRSDLLGLGFAFSKDDPYVGIDFDDCRDPKTGEINAIHRDYIIEFNCYAEVSPSGTGVKAWTKGVIPAEAITSAKGTGFQLNNLPEGMQIECYQHGRFFCFTTKRLVGKHTIGESQSVINELASIKKARKPKPKFTTTPQTELDNANANEVISRIERSKQGSKFRRLFSGNFADYESQSHADLGFCAIIAWWTKNPQVIDAIMRQSQLYREKWERSDYRDNTIRLALNYANR